MKYIFLVANATQAFTAICNLVSLSHILCHTPSANHNPSALCPTLSANQNKVNTVHLASVVLSFFDYFMVDFNSIHPLHIYTTPLQPFSQSESSWCNHQLLREQDDAIINQFEKRMMKSSPFQNHPKLNSLPKPSEIKLPDLLKS